MILNQSQADAILNSIAFLSNAGMYSTVIEFKDFDGDVVRTINVNVSSDLISVREYFGTRRKNDETYFSTQEFEAAYGLEQ